MPSPNLSHISTLQLVITTVAAAVPLHFKEAPKFSNSPNCPSAHDHCSSLISTSIRSALDCPLNYARNYLDDLLPTCVTKVVYLDSDLILVDDIAKLAATPFGDNNVKTELAAPEYCNANFTSYFTPTFWSNPGLHYKDCRMDGASKKIADLRVGVVTRLFCWCFAGKIAPVDHRWNQHGLSGDNFEGLCRDLHPGPVSLLHWSGKGKPWVRLDENRACPLDALWAPYDLLQSSNVLES
ncbi:hypothetical protein L1987_51286 [Smallanthus sonchifolius]|uniref:Uncharacterized protein n=1 Tax=Smallanthus sonchifolius TaxID=185202 RepID=A0ACB9EQ74_9ASTR|nr:hypothetical protein L1987_51286 [Smallanthus sonchifolius]